MYVCHGHRCGQGDRLGTLVIIPVNTNLKVMAQVDTKMAGVIVLVAVGMSVRMYAVNVTTKFIVLLTSDRTA